MQLTSFSTLLVISLAATTLTTAHAQGPCSASDVQTIRDIYSSGAVSADCYVLAWRSAPTDAAFCDNSACLGFLNKFVDRFPNCAYGSFYVKQYMEDAIAFCEDGNSSSPSATTPTPTTSNASAAGGDDTGTTASNTTTMAKDGSADTDATVSDSVSDTPAPTSTDSGASGSIETGTNGASGYSAVVTATAMAHVVIAAGLVM